MEFHEAVPTRLWVNWTLCGITSTWRARWRACSTSWWPRPWAQAWTQQALNISLRLWKATQDLKSSNTENHTGAMYDIYSVIPEEKRLLVNSPILQMKAIKNEVVALTIWMFLSFFFFMTIFYHRWRWMGWWRPTQGIVLPSALGQLWWKTRYLSHDHQHEYDLRPGTMMFLKSLVLMVP